ncbi:MAG: hypothetical protein ABSB11_00020 [Sedimentisphaerales bacterium]|jgi:hypothetical protein
MRNKELFSGYKSRRGNAIVGLIIVLLLVAVVYGVQRYMKSHTPDPDTAQDLTPWKEWRLREKPEKPVPPISEKQAKIPGTIKFDMNARLLGTETPRGDLVLSVGSEGQIYGDWSGTYSNDKRDNFDVQNGHFDGKVYPGKIYRDEKGEDPSKLYFLGKGTFMVHKTSADAKQYRILGGDIYVRGWLSPDLSVAGEIIITSDEKYFQTFSFKAARPEKPKSPL